jgi:hypothetical protein
MLKSVTLVYTQRQFELVPTSNTASSKVKLFWSHLHVLYDVLVANQGI